MGSRLTISGVWIVGVAFIPSIWSQETARLQEKFEVGRRYQVQVRVQLTGSLTVPGEKGKPEPKPLPLTGESAIDYDERVLGVDRDGAVNRTIRVFRRVDFERQLGDAAQKTTLRQAVRRVVQVRMNQREVAFSPDGALTWGEIDLLRTDVFTPALTGLLPGREVRVGEKWKASTEAVKELTDLEQIEEGGLECRLERILEVERRAQARVSFSGSVAGTNEDGPARQQLNGYFVFDLQGGYLRSLSLNGKHALLNADRKEMGRVEGRFVLSRSPTMRGEELSDDALRRLTLEPDAENTRLLYENEDLGLGFHHPRRWRVSGVQGRQVTLDSADGHGILLTVDALAKVPTGAQFLEESRGWLEKQKGRVGRVIQPREVPGTRGLEHFALEVDLGGEKSLMAYYVARQGDKGATIAARLLSADLGAVTKEVEAIARSVKLR